jgi:PTS system nitrogen regulatory IIA component
MSLQEAADYLHVSVAEMERLVKKRQVPFSIQNGRETFRKQELHDWATTRIIGADESETTKIHETARKVRPAPDRTSAFLSQFLVPEGCTPELKAKTPTSVLRKIVQLAAQTHLVTDDDLLLKLLQEREELFPTAFEGGIAMPHTRVHPDYLFLDAVLLVARIPGGVGFRAPDGKLTDLFFVPCSPDDRTHLYMLTRLARMLRVTELAEVMRECETGEEMVGEFSRIEEEFVAKHVSGE